MKAKYKSVFQNLAGTLVFIVVLGMLVYFGFYLRVSRTDSQNKEITGIVREKWVDVAETEQGSNIKPKALIESETGGKTVINFERKVHDQIRIGTLLKRETNGEIKILP